MAESEEPHRASAGLNTSVSLPEENLNQSVGLALGVASFNLSKQWLRNIFMANLFALIDYSSSGDVGFAEMIIEALTAGRYRLGRCLFLFAAPLIAMSDSTLPPATTMITSPFFPAVLWVMASGMGVNRARFRCCSPAQSTL